MEHYLAFKSKEILTHAVTWMNPEDLKLSELIHHKRTNIISFHVHEIPRVVNSLRQNIE